MHSPCAWKLNAVRHVEMSILFQQGGQFGLLTVPYDEPSTRSDCFPYYNVGFLLQFKARAVLIHMFIWILSFEKACVMNNSSVSQA